MNEVNLEKLKAQIPEPDFRVLHERDYMFRMSHAPGYAQALWNFTVAMMEAEAESLETIYQVVDASHDLTHLCGFHKLRFDQSRWAQMRWFWTRVWNNAEILTLKPQMKDYIEYVCENSRVRWGRYTRPMGLMYGEHLPWRTPEWFRARSGRKPRTPRVIRPKLSPMAEFWPFVSTAPSEEHDLLVSVDKLVPRSLAEDVRADICQDIIIALLSGEATLDNVRDALPRYIKWFFNQSPSKYSHLSLDALIFEDGAALGSTIAAEYA